MTNNHPLLAAAIVEGLSANGRNVELTDGPVANTGQLIVTTALGPGNGSDIHWQALEQIQSFRQTGGKSLILLQDTGGRFHSGPSQGWHGGMSALARTAALEWPEMTVRCIDIAIDSNDLEGTTQRLLSAMNSMLTVVGVDYSGKIYSLQAGAQLSQPQQKLPSQSLPEKTTTPVTGNDVWLVSGGARGVTASCIEAMAQRTTGSFALLGRSALIEWPSDVAFTENSALLRRSLAARALEAGEKPAPKEIGKLAQQMLAGHEIRSTLKSLEAAGVTARYYPCDISDQQQVDEVVARIQGELGTITAIVHGAGVLADSLLVDKTRAQFDRVFKTKVGGLQNLLSALGDTPLSYIALFSSAAAFYGNTGQADYAMANEVLNRVAQSLQQRWPDATVKSFNWGPWDSGMVDQTLARYFEERGISLIPVQEGAEFFASEMLTGDRRYVELLVGDSWAVT